MSANIADDFGSRYDSPRRLRGKKARFDLDRHIQRVSDMPTRIATFAIGLEDCREAFCRRSSGYHRKDMPSILMYGIEAVLHYIVNKEPRDTLIDREEGSERITRKISAVGEENRGLANMGCRHR